ncbi:hypothetical protein ACIO6T_34660 [Streptomyces sp. NPDC087532]|uniref:hypothetical protein n=1 Tax=unclassified Streptomyces TaxID=2593676 RepID=UPI0033314B95
MRNVAAHEEAMGWSRQDAPEHLAALSVSLVGSKSARPSRSHRPTSLMSRGALGVMAQDFVLSSSVPSHYGSLMNHDEIRDELLSSARRWAQISVDASDVPRLTTARGGNVGTPGPPRTPGGLSRGPDGSPGTGQLPQLGARHRHRGDGLPVGVPPQPHGQEQQAVVSQGRGVASAS